MKEKLFHPLLVHLGLWNCSQAARLLRYSSKNHSYCKHTWTNWLGFGRAALGSFLEMLLSSDLGFTRLNCSFVLIISSLPENLLIQETFYYTKRKQGNGDYSSTERSSILLLQKLSYLSLQTTHFSASRTTFHALRLLLLSLFQLTIKSFTIYGIAKECQTT